MSTKELFLDTSIQISRRSSDEDEIKKITKVLNEYEATCTSSYVRLEFKQSHIQDLIYLHKNLVKEKSITKIFRIIKGLNAHIGHKRKLGNMMEALCAHFAGIKSFSSEDNFDEDLAEKVALSLELALENIWEWFEKSVTKISDCTECIRAKEAPKKLTYVFEARVKSCKPSRMHCKLNSYFKEKEKEFIQIRDYIKGLDDSKKKKPDELNGIIEAIETGLKNPDDLCNTPVCRKLGDALIAVEAMQSKEMFTKDVDQSEVICKSLGLSSKLLS